ncbi:MAG: hypothetical protein R2883_02985 [Caldisericia bacterium]
MHMTRAIAPSAKGSSIRVTQGEITNVKKEFSLDVIEVEKNTGALFAVFDADSNEIYTYSHWTLRVPYISQKVSQRSIHLTNRLPANLMTLILQHSPKTQSFA